MREAHAGVAVRPIVLTGRTVQQVDVGGTVRGGAGAVLWEVTRARRSSTHRAGLRQLGTKHTKQQIRADVASGLITLDESDT